MSSFRKYGGKSYSGTSNIVSNNISNMNQLNINKVSGQINSKETFGSHIDMSCNSLLKVFSIQFCDGTVQNTTAKSFIIDHPDKDDKYLIHSCLEGPEVGVYYRGVGEITNNESVKICLPEYVRNLAYDFSVQLTPIYKGVEIKQLYSSRVVNNEFNVYGENTEFFWLVHGSRGVLNVEPYKSDVDVKGDGPYKWI
jgi:hypothetical protein